MFRLLLVSFLSMLILGTSTANDEPLMTLHFLAPHPLAGSAVDPGMAMAMLQHYGKPPAECGSDEKVFQIAGVPGMVCSPSCDASGGCPIDVPDGVTARPTCALENRSTGEKYCVLICQDGSDNAVLRGNVGSGQCGDASCQIVQAGLGICTWDV